MHIKKKRINIIQKIEVKNKRNQINNLYVNNKHKEKHLLVNLNLV